MRITGDGVWGPPKDPASALAVLRRAVELGVNFIDTADLIRSLCKRRVNCQSTSAIPERACDRDQGRMESPRAEPVDP
jgi:hypothetical protein